MAQHDFTISGSSSGATLVSQLNSWETALLSAHSGSARPSYATAGTVWLKNSVTPWEYYMYDGADDILIGTFNATTNAFVPAGVTTGKYFGTGADGALNITSNTTWDTEDYSGNTISANDTGIVRRDLSSLTISGGAVVTAAYRAQCMVVYCTGDVNITNGTLHMDSRGANATASALTFTRNTASNILQDEDGLVSYTIPAVGGAGGATHNNGSAAGNPGSAGLNGQTGGGGSGRGNNGGVNTGSGGAGAAGTAFCGGSGGGAGGNNGSGTNGTAGAANGAAGGNGGGCQANYAAGGGAGNPVGTGAAGAGASVVAPTGGGGGTLIIVAAGNVTIGSGGVIRAAGGNGGNATGSTAASGGGGAGGGSILILHGGSYSNNGTVSAPGGSGGVATTGNGGAGGAGSVVTAKISV